MAIVHLWKEQLPFSSSSEEDVPIKRKAMLTGNIS